MMPQILPSKQQTLFCLFTTRFQIHVGQLNCDHRKISSWLAQFRMAAWAFFGRGQRIGFLTVYQFVSDDIYDWGRSMEKVYTFENQMTVFVYGEMETKWCKYVHVDRASDCDDSGWVSVWVTQMNGSAKRSMYPTFRSFRPAYANCQPSTKTTCNSINIIGSTTVNLTCDAIRFYPCVW